MPASFDRTLKQLLQAAGCVYIRPGKGSHEIWRSPITKITFSVPANITSRHTANAVLKSAGLHKGF